MAYHLNDKLVIAVSSGVLFDRALENHILKQDGVQAYRAYEAAHEEKVLKPGIGFPLIRQFLALRKQKGLENLVEVIILSRGEAVSSLRLFRSTTAYHMDITRAVLTGGAQAAAYLEACHADLFLSSHEEDVASALERGIAAGLICQTAERTDADGMDRDNTCQKELRIAFDGDAVLFEAESEQIYEKQGLRAFEEHEVRHAKSPLGAGPFAHFLKKLTALSREADQTKPCIRTALVTARSAPAHERVIRTLLSWDVQVDEVFFLGGVTKKEFLKAFDADIFFDDKQVHIEPASEVVPAALVPYHGKKIENTGKQYEIRQCFGRDIQSQTEPVYRLCGAEG